MSKPFETSLEMRARRLQELEVDTEEKSEPASQYDKRSSLPFNRNSLTPRIPSTPTPAPPTNSANTLPSKLGADSPQTTPILKKRLAPQPPQIEKESLSKQRTAEDPSIDIEERPQTGIPQPSVRNYRPEDRDTDFQFDSLSRAGSEWSDETWRYTDGGALQFRKVTFKDFLKRGFLVPTWYIGIVQMTVGISTAIIAIAEILLPQGSDVYGNAKWFTLKTYNIFGLNVISSLTLFVAGCYLVRAQIKNDLRVVKLSAGYAGLSIILHLFALIMRLVLLWLGDIAPIKIGIPMFVAGLCVMILTLFGFWFSSLGFGVYLLFVFNHAQEVESLNDLGKDFGPAAIDLLDRYMGVTN